MSTQFKKKTNSVIFNLECITQNHFFVNQLYIQIHAVVILICELTKNGCVGVGPHEPSGRSLTILILVDQCQSPTFQSN